LFLFFSFFGISHLYLNFYSDFLFSFIRSAGFILEGFPNDSEEAEIMADAGFYPSAALSLEASEEEAVARMLPPKVARWREKFALRQERRQTIAKLRATRRAAAIERRRGKLLSQKEVGKLDRLVSKDWRLNLLGYISSGY